MHLCVCFSLCTPSIWSASCLFLHVPRKSAVRSVFDYCCWFLFFKSSVMSHLNSYTLRWTILWLCYCCCSCCCHCIRLPVVRRFHVSCFACIHPRLHISMQLSSLCAAYRTRTHRHTRTHVYDCASEHFDATHRKLNINMNRVLFSAHQYFGSITKIREIDFVCRICQYSNWIGCIVTCSDRYFICARMQ